jgi:hypothetical protein
LGLLSLHILKDAYLFFVVCGAVYGLIAIRHKCRSAAAHAAWNGRMTPYEPFKASPLVNSNSMSERSSAPAKVESVTSFGSSSSLLDGLLPAAVQPDNYLDNLLSEYISIDDITGGIRPMPSSIPHTFSPSPFSPVEYCTSPGLRQYADLSASLPAANNPLFSALNSVSPVCVQWQALLNDDGLDCHECF